MAAWSDLLRAVADLFRALQWPAVAGIITYFFRRDIQQLLRRVKHGKLLGIEVDLELKLEKTLDEISTGTRERERELIPITGPATTTAASLDAEQGAREKVLELAAISPRAAFMLLSTDIEEALRRYAVKVDPTIPAHIPSVRQLAAVLARRSPWFGPSLVQNLDAFWKLRNLIVHRQAGDDVDVLSAIDSGLLILQDLTTLPVPESPDDGAVSVLGQDGNDDAHDRQDRTQQVKEDEQGGASQVS